MRCLLRWIALASLVLPLSAAVDLQKLDRHDGFLPFYFDSQSGRLLLEVPQTGTDLLYFVGIAQGVGSVELGLDPGLAAVSAVIHFERVGQSVYVIQKNLAYRAVGESAALARSMHASFADSVLASLPVESEANGKLVVDATPLLIRDAAQIQNLLENLNQGTYSLDNKRSYIYLANTKAFARNTEIETELTYASTEPGRILSRVVPEGSAVSIRVHHSFLALPDDGYKPRRGDERVGTAQVFFHDYSKPFSEETDTYWVRRFRLEKKDPKAHLSEPKQPIVYYLDSGIPEPVRSAMRNGILWWNKAFEAAGFLNAVQVKDPTPDMDPMDIRYNFVFWVNRNQRGYSVGDGFTDPRTGEIIAARVRMDSARIRTISRFWHSYAPVMAAGNITEQQLVLARQTLVTAHEIGHTLGFPHAWNSSLNNRASVMEYPSPRLTLTADGKIDARDAYQTSIGAFDTYMVRYAYSEFAPGQERASLEALIEELRGKNLLYTPLTDPRWDRYDEGSDAAQYLEDTLAQRKVILRGYGLAALRSGEEVAHLRGEGLWMTYLHHRWAIDTAAKYVGGMYHNYVHKGDRLPATTIVPAAYQRKILDELMKCLQPENLSIPEPLLELLTTDPAGADHQANESRSTTEPEEFRVSTGYAFDQLSAARTLADLVVSQILAPETANRLISFADRQENALTLPELLDHLMTATWDAKPAELKPDRSLQRVSRQVVLENLMILAASPKTGPEARATVLDRLTKLKSAVTALHDDDPVTDSLYRQSERDLIHFLADPSKAPAKTALPQPAGAPI